MPRKKKVNHDLFNDLNVLLREKTEDGYVQAANELLLAFGEEFAFTSGRWADAKAFIHQTFYALLDKEDYISAATLAFGYDYFDCRSQHILDLHRLAHSSTKLVSFGASSMSKTFFLGLWLVMDLARDPNDTKIIVASVGEKHLKQNLFSGLINAIQASVIDLNMETSVSGMYIKPNGVETEDIGVYGKTFPADKTYSTGRMRGIKPSKRLGKPHPRFGKLGRVRVLIDEASSVPEGVYLDFGSVFASSDGKDTVKMFVCFNPTLIEHWTTEIAAPVGGIDTIDEDKDIEWVSQKGWNVYRLDGMRSPNVIARKTVCHGIITWEAMQDKIASGDNSFDYWVYGRGMWMRQGSFSNIIPMDFLTRNRGEFIFPNGADNVASVDVAFSGDKVIFTLGRWGLSSGWVKPTGDRELFMLEGTKVNKWSLQIDQQFEIKPDNDSIKLANEIIRLCKDMNVRPEWLVLDRTSIGKGVYDLICQYFGACLGINWQEGATTTKIFAEDQDTPDKLYGNVGTEMIFATKFWLEHGVIRIGTAVQPNPLFVELTTRRYKPKGTRVVAESKPEYKSRAAGNRSPDHCDSLVQLPQLCRLRGENLPSLTGKTVAGGGAFNWETIETEKDSIDEVQSLRLR